METEIIPGLMVVGAMSCLRSHVNFIYIWLTKLSSVCMPHKHATLIMSCHVTIVDWLVMDHSISGAPDKSHLLTYLLTAYLVESKTNAEWLRMFTI